MIEDGTELTVHGAKIDRRIFLAVFILMIQHFVLPGDDLLRCDVAHFQLSKEGQQLGTDNMVFRCPCVFFDMGLHICRVLLHEARKRHIQIGGGFIELFALPSQCFPLCLETASLRLLAFSCPVRIAVDHTPCVRFFFLIDCHYESFLSGLP